MVMHMELWPEGECALPTVPGDWINCTRGSGPVGRACLSTGMNIVVVGNGRKNYIISA
jgi:hypothetical protein